MKVEEAKCPAQRVADEVWNDIWQKVKSYIPLATARRAASMEANKAATGVECTCDVPYGQHYSEY